MARRWIVRPWAESDLDRAASWYEDQRPGVGLRFLDAADEFASNLWIQSSLNQKQRLQQLFFPDGIRFDGKGIVGTSVTLPVFNYLRPVSESKKKWWTRPSPVGTCFICG
jgi:hypothetical protein